MYKAFVGGSRRQRLAWIAGEITSPLESERKQIVLCPGKESLQAIFDPKNDVLLANGYKGGSSVDIASEFFQAASSLGDAGTGCADAFIPDWYISMTKDPFWLTSSKIILTALFRGACRHWGNLHRSLPLNEIPSLTSVLFRFISDLLVAKMSSSTNDRRAFTPPHWWGDLPTEDADVVQGIVGSNAGVTVGCIFGEFYTTLNPFRKWMPEKKTDSVLQGKRRVIVYTPSVTPEFLGAFLSAAGEAWKSFDLSALEFDSFSAKEIDSVSRFMENCGQKENSTFRWTGEDLVSCEGTDFFSGDTIFGSTQSGRVIQKFRSLVREYTGGDSGQLVTPEVRGSAQDGAEDPGFLRSENAFVLESGRWYLQGMPELLSVPAFILEEDPDSFCDQDYEELKNLAAGKGRNAPADAARSLEEAAPEYMADLERRIAECNDPKNKAELCALYCREIENGIRLKLTNAAADSAFSIKNIAAEINSFLERVESDPALVEKYSFLEKMGSRVSDSESPDLDVFADDFDENFFINEIEKMFSNDDSDES
ncbi:MAG: hypothetical protein EOM62_14675 [Bacteroidia bacterium]|nr:hypothetical protein [Bacteroidia bacterium]